MAPAMYEGLMTTNSMHEADAVKALGSPRAKTSPLPSPMAAASSVPGSPPEVVAHVAVTSVATPTTGVQFQDCKRQLKTCLLGDDQRDRKDMARLTEEYRKAEQAFVLSGTSGLLMARLLEAVRAMSEHITTEDEEIVAAANKTTLATLVLKQMQRHAHLLQVLADDLRMPSPRCSMSLSELRPHIQALFAWYGEVHNTLQNSARQGVVSRLFKKKSKEQDQLKVYERALTEHGDILTIAFQPRGQNPNPIGLGSQPITYRTGSTVLPASHDDVIGVSTSLDDLRLATQSAPGVVPTTLQHAASTNPFADMKSWDSIMRQHSGYGPADSHTQAMRSISSPAAPSPPSSNTLFPPPLYPAPQAKTSKPFLLPPPGTTAQAPATSSAATSHDDLIMF